MKRDMSYKLLASIFFVQDAQDVESLLSRNNVDREALLLYAKEAAVLSTDNQLANLDFALNHKGEEDVAIFDFTSMHQAEHSSMIFEREGKKLLTAIVGDTLIEVCFAASIFSCFCCCEIIWFQRGHKYP